MFVANALGIHNSLIGQGVGCGTDIPPHIRIRESRRTPAPARCDDLPHISVGTPSGVPTSLSRPAVRVSASLSAYSPGGRQQRDEAPEERKGAWMSDNPTMRGRVPRWPAG